MKRKGLWLKILRPILFVILSLVIGLTVYGWNARRLVGSGMAMPFGYGMAVVLSGSMEPELSVDDLIIVKDTGDYALRDVVVFPSDGSLVVHRIVDMADGKVLTQGDANSVPDEWMDPSRICGEVVGVIPGVGLAVNAIKSPVGIVVILAAVIFLLELSYRKERSGGQEDIEKIKEEIRRLRSEQEAEEE